MIKIKENWYALYLSIVKNVFPEKALSLILGERVFKSEKRKSKKFVYIDDPVKLIQLKKNHTYKEIAEMYGTNRSKIFVNIKYYKEHALEMN